MQKYAVGLHVGLYSLDEFSRFLDAEILAADTVPDICIHAFFSISCGAEAVLSSIRDSFYECGYQPQDTAGCTVEKAVLTRIREKYQCHAFSLKQACEMLQKVSLHFDPYSEINVLADYYALAEQGIFYTMEQVQDMLEKSLNIK